jgi:hypothetical protein
MDAKGSATPRRRLRELETWAFLFGAEQTQGPSTALGMTEYRDDRIKVTPHVSKGETWGTRRCEGLRFFRMTFFGASCGSWRVGVYG